MKQRKAVYLAAIILLVLLSNSYIAQAYIVRKTMNSNTSVPAATIPENSGEPTQAISDEPLTSENEQPSTTDADSTPADAPVPAGYVYLTLDDGPDPASTPLILDILDQYNISATFFVIGTQIEQYPDLLVEIDRRGHYVGNHTYNHKYREIYASNEAFVDSLRKNEELIHALIGKRPQIVRDPGGLLTQYTHIKSYTEKHGYVVMDWGVDSFDSRTPVPDSTTIAGNVYRQSLQGHLWPEMIILLHDTRRHRSTIQALPVIIESLLERGFSFMIPVEETI